MITYADLCQAYGVKHKEYHAKMRTVRQLYKKLTNAIADDLGLLGKSFDNGKGESITYVKMGVVEDFDELKSVDSEHDLPVGFTLKNNVAVCYTENSAIALTLEFAPNSYPKRSIFIRVDAELNGDVLRVVFPDNNEMAFDVAVDDEHADFSPVVAAYKQLVMNTL